MASVSLFNLSAGTTLASGDVLVFCDISDTTQSANGSDLKITLTNFFAGIPVPVNVTSASATALAVGRLGATTPAFTVDASTASQVAGLKVTGAATGGTVAVVATDSGSNTNLTLNAKGSGTIGIGTVSTGLTTIGSALAVTGAATLASTLGVTGASTLAAVSATTGAFSGAVTAATTLGVTGATTLAGLSATTGAFSGAVTAATTLGVTGATTLAALSATTGAFSGAVTAATTLGVTGATTLAALSATTGTFSSTLGVTGAATLSSTLTIGGLTYTFPASQTANRFLKTDGSGGLSWATILEQIALTDLSDVTITSQATGQMLRASSASAWANSTATFPDTATAGHLLYASASNVWSGLTIGAANTVLLSTGSAPSWVAQSTLTAPAGLLTGTTLASNVVTSSLTAIGTLASGAVPASLVTAGTFGSGSYTFPGTLAITGTLTGVTTLTTSGAINGQTISNAASFTGTLDVAGATTLSSTLTLTHASAPRLSFYITSVTERAYIAYDNTVPTLRIDSDEGITFAPNNTSAFTLSNSGNGAFTGTLSVMNNTATGNGLLVQCDSVTTGNVAKFVSNNGGAFTGTVVSIINDFNNAQTATALYVRQDDDGKGIVLDMTRFGVGLTINSPSSAATAISTTGGGSVSFSGTLAVSGTITSTSGNNTLIFNSATATTGYQYANINNTSGALAWGVENSSGGGLLSGTSAYAGIVAAGGVSILTFGTNGAARQTIAASGAIRFHTYGAGTATFDASGNITSVSDERQKTDIVPFTAGLAELRGIRPITHKFSVESGLDTEHSYIGFSAQNVREHLPGVVFEHAETGTLSLWDRGLLAATVNAVQSLDQRVTALEAV